MFRPHLPTSSLKNLNTNARAVNSLQEGGQSSGAKSDEEVSHVFRRSASTRVRLRGSGAISLALHSIRVSEDGSRIWLVSPRAMIVSQGHGRTWTSQALGFETSGRLRLYQPNENTLLVANNTGLFASSDAGKTWRPYNLPDLPIRDLASVGATLVVSTQRNGLQVSYDRGETWQRIEGPLAEGYFPVLARHGPAILAASSTEGLYALEVSGKTQVAGSNAQSKPSGAQTVWPQNRRARTRNRSRPAWPGPILATQIWTAPKEALLPASGSIWRPSSPLVTPFASSFRNQSGL